MKAETASRLTDDVLEILSKNRLGHEKSGTRPGEESLSFLIDSLRWKGWKNLGRPGDFESELVRLGFSIREEYRGRGFRRAYVHV